MNTIPAHQTHMSRPQPVRLAGPKDNLLRRMRIVAKVRFAAHERLEAKAAASNYGLQIAAFYATAIGIFLIQFPSQLPSTGGANSLNYVALICSVFVQILALLESYRDYSGRARKMHDCAVEVNGLLQQLELDPRDDWQTLEGYRLGYHAAIRDADVNHNSLDFRCAQLEPSRLKNRGWLELLQIAWFNLRCGWNVYGATTFVLSCPWLVWYALRAYGFS